MLCSEHNGLTYSSKVRSSFLEFNTEPFRLRMIGARLLTAAADFWFTHMSS